jgi:hypothetical protein
MLYIHTVMVFAMSLPVLALSEPSSCGDLRLAREITLLSAQMNIANFRLLKLINEFDIRGGWRSGGAMRSCAPVLTGWRRIVAWPLVPRGRKSPRSRFHSL